jgi:hypothetical protein
MMPGTSEEPLIYTSASYVYIYTYSGDKVGELMGFSSPAGLCSDSNGDVYVTDAGTDLIYEYARGGTKPIDVLDDSGQVPSSCAVDPTTGDIAVANLGLPPFGGKSGNLLVYPPGSSQTPVAYTSPNIISYAFCDYDAAGNLYVDGVSQKHGLALAELPKGGSFIGVQLAGVIHRGHRAGGLQWDGQDVAIADSLKNVIYRIAVSGNRGKIVDMIHIDRWRRHYEIEFSIQGQKLLFPFDGELGFYNYPAGRHAKTGFFGSIGSRITVSAPQSP